MLNKCANPGCVKPFRKLEDGKLFLVEVEASTVSGSGSTRAAGQGGLFRQLEHYWLCDPCASELTLSFERERGVVAVPLARQVGKRPAASVRRTEVAGTPSNEEYHRMQAVVGGTE